MTAWELVAAGFLYLNVARRLFAHDPWLAFAWLCYAGANAGFVMSMLKMVQK